MIPQFFAAILAQQPRLSELGDRFSRSDPAQWSRTLLMSGVVLLVLLLVSAAALWLHFRQRRLRNCPRRLFRELCRAHRLNKAQQRLLWQLAAAQGLSQPATIFLAPERFDPHHLPERLRGRQREIERVRDRLFGRQLSDSTAA